MLDQSLAAEAHAQGVEKLVVGAVIHDRGRVLVVTRSAKDDFLPGIDELPSGSVHAGETLLEGLNRELREEVGFPAGPLDAGFLETFDYASGSGRLTRQFTVSLHLATREIRLSEEHSTYQWVAPDDLDLVSLTPETKSVVAAWFGWAASNNLH